jgi:hypothetical protein
MGVIFLRNKVSGAVADAYAIVNRDGATVVNRDGATVVADPTERTS